MFNWLQSHAWLCTYIMATLAIMTFLLNFVFRDRDKKNRHKKLDEPKSGAYFTEEEIDILAKWTHAQSLEAHKVLTKDGSYFIAGGERYEISSPQEQVKWDDFFDRMQRFGFIDQVRVNGRGDIVYQLKKPAFIFIDSLY